MSTTPSQGQTTQAETGRSETVSRQGDEDPSPRLPGGAIGGDATASPQSSESGEPATAAAQAPSPAAEPAAASRQPDAADDTNMFSWFSLLRGKLTGGPSASLRTTLESALRDGNADAEDFSQQERDMLLRILRFGALRVDDVMVPRADIIAIDESASVLELLRLFNEAGHSRIPIYRDTLDDLRGMVHIKDLVAWVSEKSGLQPDAGNGSEPAALTQSERTAALAEMFGAENGNATDPADQWQEGPEGGSAIAAATALQHAPSVGQATLPTSEGAQIIPLGDAALQRLHLQSVDLSRPVSSTRLRRDILYVPPSMPAVNLLLRMQSTRVHLAMVVDEYGGTDGLISIEDLVEEIVGAIEDEHDDDTVEDLQERLANGDLVASARLAIEDLEGDLGPALLEEMAEDDIDTLGGLVFSLAGRVPVRGELIRHSSGIEFEVLEADPRRIRKVRIHRRRASAGRPVGRPVVAPGATMVTANDGAQGSNARSSQGTEAATGAAGSGDRAGGEATSDAQSSGPAPARSASAAE